MQDTYKELVKMEEYRAAAHRPTFRSFDEYVAQHPEGERFRRWLTEDGKQGLVIFPAPPNWCGLPGDYFWAYIGTEYRKITEEEREKGQERRHHVKTGTFFVHVNDCDDAGGNKRGLTWEEANQELENLVLLAPFTIRELEAFGYNCY